MTTRKIRIVIFLFAAGSVLGLRSDLRAQIWGLVNKTHRSTQIIPGEGKVIFSISNHLFFSSDLGKSFTVDDGNASDSINGFAIGSIGQYYFSSPQGLFSSPAYNDINNENWVHVDSTNLPPITALYVRPITDPTALDEIYAGTANGLWRRNSGSKIWTKIHDAGNDEPILQITAFNNNIYYRSQNSVFASHDGGSVWREIANSVTNAKKTGLAAMPDSVLYLAISEKPGSHVLQSIDGGNSFNGIKGIDFSAETIQTLVTNTQGDIYIGGGFRSDFNQDSITQGFVYRLLHDQINWENLSADLPSAPPTPEIIGMGFSSNGNVFAGTDSAGLWITLLPSAVREIASQTGIILSQNFPNPANTTTEFSVFTDHTIKASLMVFDALGRNILEVSNGELSIGTHIFSIDTKNLPNGAYFYRLQTPEVIESKAFVISR